MLCLAPLLNAFRKKSLQHFRMAVTPWVLAIGIMFGFRLLFYFVYVTMYQHLVNFDIQYVGIQIVTAAKQIFTIRFIGTKTNLTATAIQAVVIAFAIYVVRKEVRPQFMGLLLLCFASTEYRPRSPYLCDQESKQRHT